MHHACTLVPCHTCPTDSSLCTWSTFKEDYNRRKTELVTTLMTQPGSLLFFVWRMNSLRSTRHRWLTKVTHTTPPCASPHLPVPHHTSLFLTTPPYTSPHLPVPHHTSLHLTTPPCTSPLLPVPHHTSLYLTTPPCTLPHLHVLYHSSLYVPHCTSPHYTSLYLNAHNAHTTHLLYPAYKCMCLFMYVCGMICVCMYVPLMS